MNFDDVCKNRQSIRQFKNADVEFKKLYDIIDCARQSPSAKNRQPWFFYLLTKEEKNSIAEILLNKENLDPGSTTKASAQIIFNAPTAFLVCAKNTSLSDYISIGCAVATASLKAVDLELGSLIVADIDIIEKEIQNIINCKYTPIVLFLLGYPKDIPPKKSKKNINEISNL